jgi:hypothetical protein
MIRKDSRNEPVDEIVFASAKSIYFLIKSLTED